MNHAFMGGIRRYDEGGRGTGGQDGRSFVVEQSGPMLSAMEFAMVK